jgi:PAS domain S-box-containing protein
MTSSCRPSGTVEILHLEDSDLDADFVRQRLERSDLVVSVWRVTDRSSFLQALDQRTFDIILSDYEVPGFDGLAALELAKERRPEVPFLFVSGAMGEELATETLKRGATDYVLKDRLSRLVTAVERALSEAEERRERRKAEERAVNLLESLADGYVVLDHEYCIGYLNAAFEKLVGKSREELLNHELCTSLPEHSCRSLKSQLRPVLDRGETIEIEHAVPEWDRVFLLKATPADGGVCIQFREITEARRSESALKTAEERFHFVRKSSGVGFWYCDLPFSDLEWDATVKSHFHLAPDAVVTIDTFFDRLHPEDREPTRRAIDESIHLRKPYRIDYRTVSPDGRQVKWIRAIGRSGYDEAGNPIRFDGITIDLTDRIAVEEQVREQAQELEAINRVGQAMAAELDLQKLVQSITDATTELAGAEVGAFFYNSVNDDGEQYLLSCVSSTRRHPFERFPMPRATPLFAPTFRGECVVRLDDVTRDERYGKNPPFGGMPQGHFPVRSYLAVPVVSRNAEVLGGLFFGHERAGVFTERSERLVQAIAAQAAVAIDNAYLFDAVRKANQEKDRLLDRERAARSDVERASRMKDEFLATLSHELRTPLNAILGWAQVLQLSREGLPGEMQEGVDIIERNARAQAQIIDDLLDMNRIISGRIRLDVQRIDLAPVVQAAIETVQPAASAKELRLQAVLDPCAGPISADPSRLQQVFWNLLINAVKFTPKGGRIQVVVECVDSHVEVHVTDSGEGIDPEFLPLVFDRFRQADATSTRRHGGLGLGLAIVKQLVELHGGSVRARSAGKGFGSTFTVSLPLTAIQTEPEALSRRRHPRAAGTTSGAKPVVELAGLKILVVDDEADARSLLKRLLENCDATVLTAASAEVAIEIVPRERPDVIVSDIGMPDEDGYALIRRIRALPAGSGGQTPAIALTAYARAEDRVAALRAGFQHHLTKPVEPAELMAVIASLVERRSAS